MPWQQAEQLESFQVPPDYCLYFRGDVRVEHRLKRMDSINVPRTEGSPGGVIHRATKSKAQVRRGAQNGRAVCSAGYKIRLLLDISSRRRLRPTCVQCGQITPSASKQSGQSH